jgi:TatD DNase family protein
MDNSEIPSLDAHAHIDQNRVSDLYDVGAVLAMALSLEEAALSLRRHDPQITWGVGCHPRKPRAQESFDAERFRDLAERTPVVGEIGLDTGSRYAHAPLETQLQTFRDSLEIVAELPRIVSIHSYRATGLVIRELRRSPIAVPVLHWWTGNVEETRAAVELGCYFSIHSAVARHSKFRNHVPAERLLVETDHGYRDPPLAIPCRVEWVEHLVAQQYRMKVEDVRSLVWRNFSDIVRETETFNMLPEGIKEILKRLELKT